MVRGINRLVCGLTLALGVSSIVVTEAQQGRTARDLAAPVRPTYAATGTIEVLRVQGDVYMLAGAGSNVVVQVGRDALFVVDTNTAAMSEKMLAAIRGISPLPIRYIVSTSADPDHVGGNEAFAKSSGNNVNAFLQQGARVYANENAYQRMTNPKDGSSPMPVPLWPTDVFASPLMSFFNGEAIQVMHRPAAHTSGDLAVFFRKSDVIAAGDLFVTNSYPVIDARNGGTLNGYLEGLNQLIDLAIPEYNSMGGTRVVPGHGRLANEIDLVEYRDAMTIIADRITQLILEGRTVEQVKAAGVSLDYDGVYGTTTGPWTTDMFVETVYREIKGNTAPWRARLVRNVPVDELPFLSTSTRPATARPAATASAAPARRGPADPLEGKWVLNTFTSRYEPANLSPYRREMTISFANDEMTHAASTWRRQGNASPLTTNTYKAKLDGKEYQIPLTTTKVVLKRVDANTVERSLTGTDGSSETATWTLSADRKVLTIVTTGTDPTGVKYSSTQVYDKQ